MLPWALDWAKGRSRVQGKNPRATEFLNNMSSAKTMIKSLDYATQNSKQLEQFWVTYVGSNIKQLTVNALFSTMSSEKHDTVLKIIISVKS